MSKASMQAVVIHETGDPDVLRFEEVDRPEPGEGEVLIRAHAASINPIDTKYRRGIAEAPLPKVLGSDVAGVVEASRSDAFADGDQVFGMSASGAYAEYSTAPAALVARKPTDVSFVEAAAIPVTGMTAWQALLDKGGLESGQTALVAGAAGGVGHFAVQFAKLAGARVIGTGSDRNREFVSALGADEYVDYTRQEVDEAVSDVDLAVDTVGGETTGSLIGAIRDGGTLVTIAGALPEQAAGGRGIRTERLVMSPSADQMAQIAQLISDRDVRVEIAEVIPFSEVARAQALSEAGHVRGKLVLSLA